MAARHEVLLAGAGHQTQRHQICSNAAAGAPDACGIENTKRIRMIVWEDWQSLRNYFLLVNNIYAAAKGWKLAMNNLKHLSIYYILRLCLDVGIQPWNWIGVRIPNLRWKWIGLQFQICCLEVCDILRWNQMMASNSNSCLDVQTVKFEVLWVWAI